MLVPGPMATPGSAVRNEPRYSGHASDGAMPARFGSAGVGGAEAAKNAKQLAYSKTWRGCAGAAEKEPKNMIPHLFS